MALPECPAGQFCVTGAPATPASVAVTRSDGSLTATWDAVEGATHYHVTYSADGGGSWHAPVDDHWNVPTNSITFDADNAKTYMVGVRARKRARRQRLAQLARRGGRTSPSCRPAQPA